MGRRPNPQRKQDLLDEIVDYLGEHGIGDLSLRPLARQLGTSTYTLTYQFGSKDQLLTDAVRHGLAIQLAGMTSVVAAAEEVAPADLVRRLWAWSAAEDNLRLARMLIEATTLSASHPGVFGPVGHEVVSEAIELVSNALQRSTELSDNQARRLATQVSATLVGLQVDLIATGDRDRVDWAADRLCRAIEEETRPEPVLSPNRG